MRLLTFLLTLAPIFANAQCNTLVWADEFNGTSLNLSDWSYDYGTGCPSLCGWGNGELQYYTDNPGNIQVTGGSLVITALNQPDYLGSGADFTSAKIHTRNKQHWTYGRYEARIRMPHGRGLWPAFWMLNQNSSSWPTSGEIDIMEYRGDMITRTSGTLHYGASWPNNLHDGTDYFIPTGNLKDDFHIYAIEWEPGEMRWYFDGILFKTETESPATLNPPSNDPEAWPWDEDFYIILNLAVGGWFTGTTNPADIELTKPTFEVDYVRVYTDPVSLTLQGPTKLFEGATNTTYTAPTGTGFTYVWSVPSGASITSGQGTSSINVNWGGASSSGNVHCDITVPTCGLLPVDHAVTVIEDGCLLTFEDYNANSNMSYYFSSGVYDDTDPNPAPNAVNNSPDVAQYNRNGPDQWDVLKFRDLIIDDATEFESGDNIFKMDLYSSAPIGTTVNVQLENETMAQGAYPAGRRSIYTATTTTQNEWETLTFSYNSTPDPATPSDQVDNIVVLFDPGNFTSHTFHLDNFRREQTPSCITGLDSDQLNELTIYPNPATQSISIEGLDFGTDAVIVDLLGKVHANVTSNQVDISNLAPGMYQLVTSKGDRKQFVKN